MMEEEGMGYTMEGVGIMMEGVALVLRDPMIGVGGEVWTPDLDHTVPMIIMGARLPLGEGEGTIPLSVTAKK